MKSRTGQYEQQNSDMETITRQDSVFEQVNKFVQYWNSGQKASFNIECENGEAVMNMSVSLRSNRKTRHSPSKIKRNKLRAEIYRKKKQLENRTCEKQVNEQFGVDDENVLEIDSDFNGNNELHGFSSESLEHSNYQLCFLDEDDCYSCGLSSSRPEIFFETEFSISDKDEEEIDSELIMTPENCSADQCTVGPTVHCHHQDQDEDEVNIDAEECEEQDHVIDINNFVYVVSCEHFIAIMNNGSLYKKVEGFWKNDDSSTKAAAYACDRGESVIGVYSDKMTFKVNYGFEEFGLLRKGLHDVSYYQDEYWLFNMLSDMKLRYEEKGSLWLDFPKVP